MGIYNFSDLGHQNSGPAQFNVLYVDDEKILLNVCKIYLERWKEYNISICDNAHDAIKLLSERKYDAVISDYQMPGMDGIEFLKHIRRSGDNTPFIIFTGRGREEIVIEALNEGADFYLQKGGDPKSQFTELDRKIKFSIGKKRAEEEVLAHQRRESDIINFIPEAVFAIDAEGKVIAWNRAMEEMTGVSTEDMMGKGDHEYAIPFYKTRRPMLLDLLLTDEPEKNSYYSEINGKGDILSSETIISGMNPENETILYFTASPLYDTRGKKIGAIEAIQDITARKMAENSLKESEEKYKSLIEDAPAGIYYSDIYGKFIYGNKRAEEIIGYNAEELLGKNYLNLNLLNRRDIGKALKLLALNKLNKPTGPDIFTLNRKDGTKRTVDISTRIVKIGGSKVVMGIVEDLTGKREAEEEFRLTNQKLTLINSIANQHIINKITALQNNVEIAGNLENEKLNKSYIDTEKKILRDIQKVINNTKESQNIENYKPCWISVDDSILSGASRITVEKNIIIEPELRGTEIFLDSTLDKIFYKLITNAVEHGGDVTCIKFSSKKCGDDLIIVCEDDGAGIPPDKKETIFKNVAGKNISFGLFFVREYLELADMTIRETGDYGKGARFEILVPESTYRIK